MLIIDCINKHERGNYVTPPGRLFSVVSDEGKFFNNNQQVHHIFILFVPCLVFFLFFVKSFIKNDKILKTISVIVDPAKTDGDNNTSSQKSPSVDSDEGMYVYSTCVNSGIFLTIFD